MIAFLSAALRADIPPAAPKPIECRSDLCRHHIFLQPPSGASFMSALCRAQNRLFHTVDNRTAPPWPFDGILRLAPPCHPRAKSTNTVPRQTLAARREGDTLSPLSASPQGSGVLLHAKFLSVLPLRYLRTRLRIIPSCATLATSSPWRLKMRPRLKPRPPPLHGASVA